MTAHQLWFRSTLFNIESGEDRETNPFRFGRQLAHWLRERLIAQGRSVENVIPEDWGWCIVTQRKPFLLWVGCSNVHNPANSQPGDQPPRGTDVLWACIVVAERPILGRLSSDATVLPTEELFRQVRGIIEAEPCNALVEEP